LLFLGFWFVVFWLWFYVFVFLLVWRFISAAFDYIHSRAPRSVSPPGSSPAGRVVGILFVQIHTKAATPCYRLLPRMYSLVIGFRRRQLGKRIVCLILKKTLCSFASPLLFSPPSSLPFLLVATSVKL
jgi:hypothetical protein